MDSGINNLDMPRGVPNYYWRDYTGVIPPDAIPGGMDLNRKVTYIGQAFLKEWGIIPGTIYPNIPIVHLPLNQRAHSSMLGVKILCGRDKDKFVWETANASTLRLTTINKNLVIGGNESETILYIGRVKYQGELLVGKVVILGLNAKMYFSYKDKELCDTSYQVLVCI